MIADLDSNLKHMLGVSRNGWNPTVALIILDRPSVWYFVEFIVKGEVDGGGLGPPELLILGPEGEISAGSWG